MRSLAVFLAALVLPSTAFAVVGAPPVRPPFARIVGRVYWGAKPASEWFVAVGHGKLSEYSQFVVESGREGNFSVRVPTGAATKRYGGTYEIGALARRGACGVKTIEVPEHGIVDVTLRCRQGEGPRCPDCLAARRVVSGPTPMLQLVK